MIVLKEFPNKQFKTVEHAFEALKENEQRLISIKCAQVYKSCKKLHGFSISPFLEKNSISLKSENLSWIKEGNIYPIINTTKYYDSHGDVHFNGLWNRSLKANIGKLYYVESHSLKIADIIAWPEDVKSFVKDIPWSLVGKTYEGTTQALIYEIPENKIEHSGARKVIAEKREMQNSVRMQYVKINLALNSTSSDFKENKELYDERIEIIANKDDVEENKYFWAVDEAKIFKEGSMVIAGSNDATANIYNTEEPASGTSSKTELASGTSNNYLKSLI
ncbi:MAG: hypothetical protein AAF348_07525 [Bacteroidota bacterium]